jgi:hypothetical protein
VNEDGSIDELGVVAGGLDCTTDAEAAIPCLTVNVRDQEIGSIRMSIDTAAVRRRADRHPPLPRQGPGPRARPKDETVQSVIAENDERYQNAFWDACGMPLVISMPTLDGDGNLSPKGKRDDPDYLYDFTIDEPKPKEDKENDNVQFSCDNAPDNYNPDQADMDGDGFGDVVDLCPTIVGDNNKADTDKDGIGNNCDLCQRQLTAYNMNAADANAPVFGWRSATSRTRPTTTRTASAMSATTASSRPTAATSAPRRRGSPRPSSAALCPSTRKTICQVDNDMAPFIGDACLDGQGMPLQLADAAGPVGLLNDDDFDQDGLTNLSDKCPRLRVELTACQGPDDCPDAAECTMGVCNHPDTDNDGVGDICDTCPAKANPKQVQDGGMQADDPDSDFVGNLCETNPGCYERATPGASRSTPRRSTASAA